MDRLEAYINRGDKEFPTPLMDLALVHYQLETIHPFADGNGRVGRMMISLMTVQSGLLDMPVLYISPVMERYKDEYIDHLFDVSTKSRWDDWLVFFFARVAESCRETIEVIDRLLTLQDEFRAVTRRSGRSASVMTLADSLFDTPAISVNDAARKLGVTYAAAKTAVDKLLTLKIVVAIPNTYPRLYYSPRIRQAARPSVKATS